MKTVISNFVTFANAQISATNTLVHSKGGSSGLVVMGGGSHSKGCGFESRRRILDGHYIFHIDLL